MTPPTEARVVAVLDALLAIAGTVSGVTVLDCDTNTDPMADVIAIGYSNADPVVVDVQDQASWASAYVETITIVCLVWSWSGSVEYAPRRQRCRDMITALRTGIAADRTLGGWCGEARLGALFAWRQRLSGGDQDNASGAYVSVGFSVEVRTGVDLEGARDG